MTITAALFDFGGVILSSPFEAFAHYEADRGLPHGFIRSVNAADHHTNAWARLERSEISPDEFAAAFEEESAAMGHRVPGWDVLGLLAGEVRPEMVEVVRRCGERLHTALLTNNVVTMRAEAMAGAPPGDASPVAEVLALFDADPHTEAMVIFGEPGGKRKVRRVGLCNNKQTACIPVYPMHDAGTDDAVYPRQRIAAVVKQGVHQCAVGVAGGGVHHHAIRLVVLDGVSDEIAHDRLPFIAVQSYALIAIRQRAADRDPSTSRLVFVEFCDLFHDLGGSHGFATFGGSLFIDPRQREQLPNHTHQVFNTRIRSL